MSAGRPTRTRSHAPRSSFTEGPLPLVAEQSSLETQQALTARADQLVERIGTHDAELLRLGQQMRAAKKGSSTHAFYKRRALQILQQKRGMEQRLQRTMNMAHNLATAQDAATDLALADVIAPRAADHARLRRAATSHTPVLDEDVDEAFEELAENARDVSEILSREFALDREIEDAELEAELEEELAAEVEERNASTAGQAQPDYLQRIPGVPSERPEAYVPPPPSRRLQPGQKDAIVRRAQQRGGQ